jgi:hypothetical protein
MTKDEWHNRLVQARLNLQDADERRARAHEALSKAEDEDRLANEAWRKASSVLDHLTRVVEVEL